MVARCDERPSDASRKEMKIVLRYPRALNTGWLPTNPPDVNVQFSCKSDLGTVGAFATVDYPKSGAEMLHGHSYSAVLDPLIITSDESLRNLDPKL